MGDRVRLAIFVTVITLLIWAFAEGQSVRSQTLEITIELDEGSDARYLRPADASWSGTIVAQVTGSNAAIDRVVEQVRSPITLISGVDFSGSPGEDNIDLREALRGSDALRAAGVTISEVEPASLRVTVGALTEREFPVVPMLDNASAGGSVESLPATVRVRLPERVASTLSPDLAFAARPRPEQIQGLETGRRHVISAIQVERPLALVGIAPVTIDPPAVSVAFTLESRTASVELPTVPIHVKVAAVLYNSWIVTPERTFLQDVVITGPIDEIDRIRAGELRVTATLELGVDELESAAAGGGTGTFDATFATLPTSLRFEAADRSVRVSVARRAEAGGE